MKNDSPVVAHASQDDRPATIGQGGVRQWLYPADFRGVWTQRRKAVYAILIVVFFALPWLKVGGHQAILLDLPHRKLAFFGFVLWPQDTVLLWLLLLSGMWGVFLVTAQWGRLWCGWGCPQTVFMEGVFRHVERWIEGKPNQRRKLDNGKWSARKIGKKALKHGVFLVISSHVANTFLCYVAGTDTVIEMTLSNPADNPTWFALMAGVNLVFYADFAWFREQLCTIACPYGRWQSVLLDAHSLIVGYDPGRGESRASPRDRRAAPDKAFGDCVDCFRCVQVCPTGIDIRKGLQMECVNCTACIDACDEVMDRVERPRGLIGYTSLEQLDGRKRQAVRPRTMVYGLLFVGFVTAFVVVAGGRSSVGVQVLRAQRDAVTVSADDVMNHFQARVVNKSDKALKVLVRASGGQSIKVPVNPWPVRPGSTATIDVFVPLKRSAFAAGPQSIELVFEDDGVELQRVDLPLLGPGIAESAGGAKP